MSEEHPSTFGLGVFSNGAGDPFPAVVAGDRVVDLRPTFGAGVTTLELLSDWDAALPLLREVAERADSSSPRLDDVRPRVPVEARQILCAGANYRRHVEQMAYAMLREQGDGRAEGDVRAQAVEMTDAFSRTDPYVFSGLPTALAGAHDDVVLWGPGEQHDWELELAVVIGRGGRDIPEAEAMDHVAGYTMSNDISTRDVLARPGFPMSDIVMAKSRPTFFPTGPFIVPKEDVPDPERLRVTLRVNGEVMQDDTVDDTIHKIDRLVAYASRAVELLPGDLLLTGSPAGNAAHHGNRWLRPGDVMEGTITGLGVQRNTCVEPPG